jgi:superoxide dismutase, Fe-Mn family
MTFALPPLPYDKSALAPHISARTFEFHHGKHHKAYVDKTNELVAGTPLAGKDLVSVIRAAKSEGDTKLLNQAGQLWNHSFFWQCMAPNGGGRPTGRIAELIDRDLGGYDRFVERFKTEAVNHFASGWGWLGLRGDMLVITSLHDGDTPVATDDLKPLLTLDVWEHAYYIDYQNARAAFADAFIQHLINWDFVNQNLDGNGAARANQG